MHNQTTEDVKVKTRTGALRESLSGIMMVERS